MGYKKLRSLIKTRYKRMKYFAKAVNLSESSISYIFSGKRDLTAQNILIFGEKLGIPHDLYFDFFFEEMYNERLQNNGKMPLQG